MACVKCNGYWQCSDDPDPCDLGGPSATPIESETRCFQVYTKEEGGCKMRIRPDGGSHPGAGWDDAGRICLQFNLFRDADTGKCYVKIEPET